VRPNWKEMPIMPTKGAARLARSRPSDRPAQALPTFTFWRGVACEYGTRSQRMTACPWEHPQSPAATIIPKCPTSPVTEGLNVGQIRAWSGTPARESRQQRKGAASFYCALTRVRPSTGGLGMEGIGRTVTIIPRPSVGALTFAKFGMRPSAASIRFNRAPDRGAP
jgi:hypothetical protein